MGAPLTTNRDAILMHPLYTGILLSILGFYALANLVGIALAMKR